MGTEGFNSPTKESRITLCWLETASPPYICIYVSTDKKRGDNSEKRSFKVVAVCVRVNVLTRKKVA